MQAQDLETISSVLNGDQQAFKHIVEKHTDAFFKTAMGFVHNRQDAEEIVQDSFVKAYKSLRMFQGKSSLSTWLYRIVVRQSINFVKAKKRKKFWFAFSESFCFSSHDAAPDTILEHHEVDIRIQKAITALPEKQQIAFVLNKYEELPQKEIAIVMNTTEGGVEQLILRAKNNLRKKLGKP